METSRFSCSEYKSVPIVLVNSSILVVADTEGLISIKTCVFSFFLDFFFEIILLGSNAKNIKAIREIRKAMKGIVGGGENFSFGKYVLVRLVI
jgi:hypothetical protein